MRHENQQYNHIRTAMLDNTTGMPSFDSLETQFRGRIGRNIIHIRKTSSTMEDARELVKLAEEIGELHGTVIIADQQTRGRGRFGRSWDSKPGKDILLSLIVCPRPSIAPQLTIMASLAVALTVEALTDSTTTIKWPNDVLVDGKKICGVIAEGSMIGENFAGILGDRTERKFTTRGRYIQDLPSHQHPRNRAPESSHQSRRHALCTLGKPQRTLHRHR